MQKIEVERVGTGYLLGRQFLRHPIEEIPRLASTDAGRLALEAAEVVVDLVSGNRPQPAAKRIAGAVRRNADRCAATA